MPHLLDQKYSSWFSTSGDSVATSVPVSVSVPGNWSWKLDFYAWLFVCLFFLRYFRTLVNALAFWTIKEMDLPLKPTFTGDNVTVILPTTLTSDVLGCLSSILRNCPFEVLLVVPSTKLTEAMEMIRNEGLQGVRVLEVARNGKRAQMVKGLREVKTEIIVFADDGQFPYLSLNPRGSLQASPVGFRLILDGRCLLDANIPTIPPGGIRRPRSRCCWHQSAGQTQGGMDLEPARRRVPRTPKLQHLRDEYPRWRPINPLRAHVSLSLRDPPDPRLLPLVHTRRTSSTPVWADSHVNQSCSSSSGRVSRSATTKPSRNGPFPTAGASSSCTPKKQYCTPT